MLLPDMGYLTPPSHQGNFLEDLCWCEVKELTAVKSPQPTEMGVLERRCQRAALVISDKTHQSC